MRVPHCGMMEDFARGRSCCRTSLSDAVGVNEGQKLNEFAIEQLLCSLLFAPNENLIGY